MRTPFGLAGILTGCPIGMAVSVWLDGAEIVWSRVALTAVIAVVLMWIDSLDPPRPA